MLISLNISWTGKPVIVIGLALLAVFVFLVFIIARSVKQRKDDYKVTRIDNPVHPETNSSTAESLEKASISGPAADKPAPSVPLGQIELINTDEPTAAIIMAIISNKCEIPLNRLHFIRIKLVEEYRS